MQLDPAPRPGEPFPHELGMMIARIVEKDMDEHEHRIERFYRFQETDRRGGIDGFDLDHLGLAGLQINRAVNVDALPPARLLDRELLLARRPGRRRAARHGLDAPRPRTARLRCRLRNSKAYRSSR